MAAEVNRGELSIQRAIRDAMMIGACDERHRILHIVGNIRSDILSVSELEVLGFKKPKPAKEWMMTVDEAMQIIAISSRADKKAEAGATLAEEVRRLRLLIRNEQLPDGFAIEDDATTDLAVELAYAKQQLAEQTDLMQCDSCGGWFDVGSLRPREDCLPEPEISGIPHVQCRSCRQLVELNKQLDDSMAMLINGVASDCIKCLEAAGYGQGGSMNTLWGMTMQICSDVVVMRRQLAEARAMAETPTPITQTGQGPRGGDV
jgi:hypothetical protein